MKKLDNILQNIDQSIEHKMSPVWRFMQKYFVIFSTSLLLLLLIIFFFRVFQDRFSVLNTVIKDDLARIERILNQIDKECNILSIRSDRAFLDFLTVEKFAGSMVGCLNLAYPKHWKGPYLNQNPSVQGKLYEIIPAKDGFFVLPGYGVKLPNGLVVGRDIVIGRNTLIAPMMEAGGRLNYKGQALALKLKFKVGDWDSPRPTPETIDKINKMLKEFNEALPFAQGHALSSSVMVC